MAPDDLHFGAKALLNWLRPNPKLPERQRDLVQCYYHMAHVTIGHAKDNSAELTTALRKLLEAKDAAVRASLGTDGPPGT